MADLALRRCDFCSRLPRIEETIGGQWRVGCPSHWSKGNDDCAAAPSVCAGTYADAAELWNGRGYQQLHDEVRALLDKLDAIAAMPRKGSALPPSKALFYQAHNVRKILDRWEQPIGEP